MRKLLAQRYVIKQNLIALIGVCLSLYFSYHLMQGSRSYLRLLAVESAIEDVSAEHTALVAERSAIEKKVRMLRPGSVNRDLLDERARYVLGYQSENELQILHN